MFARALLLVAAGVSLAEAACGTESGYVGWGGELAMLARQTRGLVEVISDCSFVVRGFEVAHGAPASFYAGDKLVSDWEVSTNITGADVTIKLFDGLKWGDLPGPTLTLRTKEGVELGETTVLEPGANTIGAQNLPFLEHCLQLTPFLHLRYSVSETHIDIGLEVPTHTNS
jgi:hypothetical protein